MIWTVSFEMFSIDGLEDGEDSVFYFSIYEADVDKVVATSHYFNVTYEQADKIETTTASKADPTSHSSESTSTSTSTSEAISTTSTSAPASTTTGSDPENLVGDEKDSGGSGGLSTGAVAGISVGATLGGIAAIVGLGYFLWKRRRANKGVSQPPTEPGVSTPLAPFEYYKPDGQGTPAMSQYPPSQYPPSQYPPSQYPPSQAAAATTTERSELGDNGWNAPPHGAHRANAIGGIHEVP